MRNNIVNHISQHGYMQRFHPDSRVPSNSPPVAPDPCPVYTNILPKSRPASLHERACSFCQRTFILAPSALSPAIAVLLMLVQMLILMLVPILHCWTRFAVPPCVYRLALRPAARALHPHRSDAALPTHVLLLQSSVAPRSSLPLPSGCRSLVAVMEPGCPHPYAKLPCANRENMLATNAPSPSSASHSSRPSPFPPCKSCPVSSPSCECPS